MSADRKGGVGTALSCVLTVAEFTAAFWAPWAIGYLVATRAPRAKDAPVGYDRPDGVPVESKS